MHLRMTRVESSQFRFGLAGVPLRVSATFLAFAILLGWFSSRGVANAELLQGPIESAPKDGRALAVWLRTHDPLDDTITHPSTVWVLAAGLGVAAVYCVSVLAHELGHYFAARMVKVDVVAIELNSAGGFVEMHDDDRLTAGRLGAIVCAGPLVSAIFALSAFAALNLFGWPLTGTPHSESSAALTAACALSSAFLINVALLVFNLLPFRSFDGGQLLLAARLRASRQGW